VKIANPARRPLRLGTVSSVVAAATISSLGARASQLALPWFVLTTYGSVTRMGLVMAVGAFATSVAGIPSGALVARLGPRAAMLVCDLARAPLLVSLPILYALGTLSFPVLLGIVALVGSLSAPRFASQRLLLAALVGDDERALSRTNALLEGAFSATALLGPVTAGALIPLIGASALLYVEAAMFLGAAALVSAGVPRTVGTRQRPAPQAAGLFAGVRFLLSNRLVGALVATVGGFGVFYAALTAALPASIVDRFGGDPRIAGLFFASIGAGMLVGSPLVVFLLRFTEPLRLAAIAIVAAVIPLWFLPLPLPALGVAAALFTSMLFAPSVNAPLIAVVTTRVPASVRAQTMTAAVTVNLVVAPIGYLLVAPLLGRLGTAYVFLLIAGGMTATAGAFAAAALPTSAPERLASCKTGREQVVTPDGTSSSHGDRARNDVDLSARSGPRDDGRDALPLSPPVCWQPNGA
jgi:Major Facilitator Superfamily